MDPITVTVAGAKNVLGIGNTSIFALLRAGRLTRVKVGGRTLITVESMKRLVATGTVATAEAGKA